MKPTGFAFNLETKDWVDNMTGKGIRVGTTVSGQFEGNGKAFALLLKVWRLWKRKGYKGLLIAAMCWQHLGVDME